MKCHMCNLPQPLMRRNDWHCDARHVKHIRACKDTNHVQCSTVKTSQVPPGTPKKKSAMSTKIKCKGAARHNKSIQCINALKILLNYKVLPLNNTRTLLQLISEHNNKIYAAMHVLK